MVSVDQRGNEVRETHVDYYELQRTFDIGELDY